MWTLLARMILMLLIGGHKLDNYIYRFFCQLTDWYLNLISIITPRFMPPFLVPLYGIFFVILFRIVFWIVMYNLGLAPRYFN